MADEESIGGLGIDLGLNFQGLQADIDSAVALVQSQGTRFGDALNQALQGADSSPITQAFAATGSVISDIAKEIANAIPSALAAPDTSMVTQALSSVSAAAHDAQEILSGISVDIAAPDISGAQDAFSALSADAQQAAESVASDFATALAAPDTGTFTQALDSLSQAAQSDAQQISADLGNIGAQAPDVTPITDALAGLDQTAQAAAESITSDLSGVAAQGLDVTPITDSLSGVDDAAKAAGDALAQDLSGSTVAPLDTTPITDSLDAVDSAAQTAGDALAQDLGGVAVPAIDITPITDSLDSIDTAAQTAADAISSDFSGTAVEPPDFGPINSAFNELLANAQTAGQQFVADLFSTGDVTTAVDAINAVISTLGEGAASSGLKDYAGQLEELLKAAQDAAGELQPLADDLKNLGAGGSSLADEAGSVKELSDAASSASPAVHNLSDEETNAGHSAEGAKESVESLTEAFKLLGVAFTVEAFIEFGKSMVEAVDDMTSARIAMTALSGDAAETADTLEKLEALGVSDGLAMPSLIQAAKTMSLILPAGTDIVGILNELANVSGVTGRSIDGLTSTFDRLVQSTTLAPRQLSQMGLSMQDMIQAFQDTGKAGVQSAADVAAAWKDLSINDKMVELQTALLKLQGVQKDIADNTLTGVWHQAMAQWDADVTKMTAGAGGLGNLASTIKGYVNDIAAAFTIVGGSFNALVTQMSGDAAAITVRIQGIITALKDLGTGDFSGASKAMSDAATTIEAINRKTTDDVNTIAFNTQRTVANLMYQTSASIQTVIPPLNGLGAGLKDVGDKAGAAFSAALSAVGSFDDVVNSGAGTVGTLQRAFENVSKSINTVAKQDLPDATKAVMDYENVQAAAGASVNVLDAGFTELSKLLNQTGKTDAPAAIAGFAQLTQTFLDLGQRGLPLATAAFDATEKVISTYAKTDLSAALSMQEAFNAVLANSAAPANILTDAFGKTDALLKQMASGGDLQGAADGFTRLIAAEENAGVSAGKITQTFQDQQKVFDQMAAAGNFQGAIAGLNALADAEKAFAPNGDQFVKTLQDEQKVLDQMAATNLQGAIDGLDQLANKETALNAPAQVVTATLDDERSKLDVLANTNIEAAIAGLDKLAQHQIALNQPTQDVTKTLDDERSKLDLLANTNLEAAISGLDRLAQEQIKLNQPTQDVTKTLDDERSKLDLLANTNIAAAIQGLANLADEQTKLNQPAKDVTATLDDERSKIDQLANTNLPQAISQLGALADAQVRLNQPAKDVTATLDDERAKLSALATTDLTGAIAGFQALIDKQIAMKQPAEDVTSTIDAEGKAIQAMAGTDLDTASAKMGAFVGHLIDIGSTSTQVATQMKAWEGIIQQQATVDLPAAIGQQELYIASLIRMGAQISQIDAATIKADQMQIQLATDAVQTGDAGFGAASKYVDGITKITLAEKAAHDEAVGFADVLTYGVQGLQTAWDAMDKTIADTIVNGGNWGAAWHTILKTFETDILEGVIKGALQPLEGLLLGLISSLITGVPTALTITGTGIATLSATAGTTSTALGTLAASATGLATAMDNVTASMAGLGGAGVGGGGDTSGGAGAAAGGGTTGLVGMIAGIVGAIAGIIGDVYLHAIDEKLFSIETSTNRTANDLANLRADQWSQYNDTYERQGEMINLLQSIDGSLKQILANGTGGSGTLGEKAQQDLDSTATSAAAILTAAQDIDALTKIIASDANLQVEGLQNINNTVIDIDSEMYVLGTKLDTIITSLLYSGGNVTNSMQALSYSVDSLSGQQAATGHAITGAIDGQTGALSQLDQQSLAAAQGQYQASQDIAGQIDALTKEIQADKNLEADAIKAGDFALAQQYETAAQQASADLSRLESTVQQTASSTNAFIAGGASTISASLDTTSGFIVTAVNDSASKISNTLTSVGAQIQGAMAGLVPGLSGGTIPYTPGRKNEGSGEPAVGSPYDPSLYNGAPNSGNQGAGNGAPLAPYTGAPNTGPGFDSAGYVIGSPADIEWQAAQNNNGIGAPTPPGIATGFNTPPPPASSIITPPPTGTILSPPQDQGPLPRAPVTAGQVPGIGVGGGSGSSTPTVTLDQAAIDKLAAQVGYDQNFLSQQIAGGASKGIIDQIQQELSNDTNLYNKAAGLPYSSPGSTSISGTIPGTLPIGSGDSGGGSAAIVTGLTATADQITAAQKRAQDSIDSLTKNGNDLIQQLTIAEAAGQTDTVSSLNTQISQNNSNLQAANNLLSEIDSGIAASLPPSALTADNTKLTTDTIAKATTNMQTLIDGLKTHLGDLHTQLVNAIAADVNGSTDSLVNTINTQIGATNAQINTDTGLLNQISGNTGATATNTNKIANTPPPPGTPPPSGVGPGANIGNLAYSGLPLGYSYDLGGHVPFDMMATLHANEWVIPPSGQIALPADVLARISLPAPLPGAPSAASFGGGTAPAPAASFQQNVTLNVHGLTISDVVRQVPQLMKQLSPALAGRNY